MSDAVDVLFLTAAGPGIGLGHVRRCAALAAALDRRSAVCRFAVSGSGGGPDALVPGGIGLEWTRSPALARDTVQCLRPHAVVVDAYEATAEVVASLGIHGAYVAVIDDLATRELPADLIINGAYHAERLAYRARPETRFLLGPRYVLLHPDFAEESPRVARPVVERALISLGGDPDGTRLAETVATVQRELPEAMIDVVVGPFADAVGSCGPRVRVHRGLPSIRPLLLEADLAVSAAGMTLYECLAVGTPAVTLCVADNQKPNFEELARAGLVVPGEPDLAGAVGALARSVSRRERLCAKGRAVVDGRGASRVAAELTTFVTTSRVGGAAR